MKRENFVGVETLLRAKDFKEGESIITGTYLSSHSAFMYSALVHIFLNLQGNKIGVVGNRVFDETMRWLISGNKYDVQVREIKVTHRGIRYNTYTAYPFIEPDGHIVRFFKNIFNRVLEMLPEKYIQD